MRFLHTSDWHLGVTMQGASCEEEQRLFLDWLIETIEEKSIDVLIVAGDVFHRDQPPARLLQMYYRFLARCGVDTRLRQVVIVGGNHDSPSQLDAPAEVLSALDVHIVGGLRLDEESWRRCLCPVRSPESGEVEAVIVAVPYVQEAKLGIVTTAASHGEIRKQYAERFGYLYSWLADLAEELYPNVPLVATGHLTCEALAGSVKKEDYHEEIHQVGTIAGLPPTIFDARYGYVALGHIHRMYPVEGRRVWYSGTPVPTSRTETTTRYVLVGEIDGAEVGMTEAVKVPSWRDIHLMYGTTDHISAAILALPRQADLTPYLFIDIELETPDKIYTAREELEILINATFEAGQRPRLVDPRSHLRRAVSLDAAADDGEKSVTLKELTPEDVFTRMYTEKHGGHLPGDAYLEAFRYLVKTYKDNDNEAEGAPMLDGAKDVEAEEATSPAMEGELS